ncbi:MAG: MMPL family transporter [Acidimicrobiales bacterium]|jgi:RND superfamily putative drug exporter
MDRFFAGLGRASVRFRWFILVGWIAVVVVSTLTLPTLGSEVNNDNSHFLPTSSPTIQAFNLAIPLLGNTATNSVVVVVAARNAPLGAADAAALTREVVAAKAIPRVREVRFIGISPNRHAAELLVNAHISASDIADENTLVADLEASFRAVHPPAGLGMHVAGAVASNVANQAKSALTGNRVQDFSVVFIVVLLFFVFRSVLAPFITLIPSALALVVANRFIGGLGAHGLQISVFTQLLLIVLMLGAGTDYGLFLVFRVREELRAGREVDDAVALALTRIGESITASGGTVIFALLSLLLATFGLYHDLAVPLAVGIAVMLLTGLTLLPALLAILGRAAFWPSPIAPGTEREGWWTAVTRRLLRRPGATLGLGLVLFACLASAALSYRSGGFGGATNAPAGSDAAAGNAALLADFPQAATNPTSILMRFASPVWLAPTAQDVAAGEAVLARSAAFRTLDGPFDPTGVVIRPIDYAKLHAFLGNPALLPSTEPARLTKLIPVGAYEIYHATEAFISADGKTIQFEVSLRVGSPDSNAAINSVPRLRQIVSAAALTAHAEANGVAGDAPALYDVANTSNHDLFHIIPIAILAIAILLALVLRSMVAPLYLIVSVGLSYLAALGVSVLVFIDIAGDSGITFVLPFLMFIFLLALGEDYNILVMTRIREEARRRPIRDAVTYAVGRTGPTITSAGLVLAGSFAVLAIVGGSGPSGSQIKVMGFGLAIGILLDTFVVRVLLVPATVALLGRWNWWPSRLGRQHDTHPAFSGHDPALPGRA